MTNTPDMTLSGKTAVVIGAGRGIGRAIAVSFATRGARVVLGARTASQIQDAAAECRQAGVDATAVTVDVADWNSVTAFAERAFALMPDIGVLVNSAGIYGPIGSAEDNDVEAWVRAVSINLNGVYFVCRAFVPRFKVRGGGKIVLLGGGGAAGPLPFFSSYAASKAGLVRLADTLAVELSSWNVQINVIAPGLIDTSMQDEVLAAGRAAGAMYDKIRRLRETGAGAVSADVAAELAVYLASDASGTLTGKLIAAPHDPWRNWGERADELNGSPMYTIRRIDPFTIRPCLKDLA